MFKDKNGKQLFILGVNYWPSSSALNMWSEWNPVELEEDIIRMKELGINLCRFFLFMPDFMPSENHVNPVMLERLRDFLTLCEKHELYSMPSFFVGHMSGEDWDVSWRKERNFLTDESMIKAEKLYISEVIEQTKEFKFILGWLLSNEIPNYVGQQKPETIAEWTKIIIDTIKDLDSRPVSIGDGAWAPEVNSEYNRWKFQLRKLNKYQDFVGLHFYPRVMDAKHHAYTTAFRLKTAQQWGRPVFVEEFGTSTVLCSENNQANYYREVFYSALINNAFGTMGWCLNDFDFEDKRPYSHHAFEDRFGVVRTDKTLKPTADEYKKFSQMANRLYSENFDKIEYNAGLLIPSNYYYEYPYQFEPEFDQWYDFYLDAFANLKNSNMNIDCIFEPAIELKNEQDLQPEDNLDPHKYPVIFSPRLKNFTKNYWLKVIEYIKKGGTFYCSFANDSWVVDWDKVAGIEMDCKFGVPDFRDTDELEVFVQKDWGNFKKGDSFTIPLNNSKPENSYCPIISTDAEILMTDQYGEPFLIRNNMGAGQVYFSPYPLEILAMENSDDKWIDSLKSIYNSIYAQVYQKRDIVLNGSDLEMGIWQNKENDSFEIILLNHSWNKNKGNITISNKYFIKDTSDLKSEKTGVYSFELERKAVFNLTLLKNK